MYLAYFGSPLLSLLKLFRSARKQGLGRTFESLCYSGCLGRGLVKFDFNDVVGHDFSRRVMGTKK